MSFYQLGPNFDKHIPPEGITVVSLSEQNSCGACISTLEDIKNIGRENGLHSIWVDTKKHPEIKCKYGIQSSIQILIYQDGQFLKRLMPGNVHYRNVIDRLKNGMPINEIEQNFSRRSVNPNIVRVHCDKFEEWISDEDNARHLVSVNSKIILDAKNNEFLILYFGL